MTHVCHKPSLSPDSVLNGPKQNGIIAFHNFTAHMSVCLNEQQQPDEPSHNTQQIASSLPSYSS